jgi:uncharacterized protein YutE (UPF0331/DUF86 family)
MIALIITLGTRDIQVQQEAVSILLNPEHPDAVGAMVLDEQGTKHNLVPRIAGAFLANHYQDYKDYISYPICKPALEYVKAHHPELNQIDVLFVATDQPETVDARHRNNDTIEYAKLLCEHVLANEGWNSLEYVTVGKNIFKLDAMYDEFNRRFAEDNPLKKFTNKIYEKVYLFTQGGVDGLNNGLTLQAILHYKTKLILLGLPEGQQKVGKLNVPDQFQLMIQQQQAYELLNRYEYKGIAGLNTFPEYLTAIALYTYHRVNFDFEAAQKVLEAVSFPNTDEHERFRLTLLDQLKELQKHSVTAKLKELYWNARLKFTQEAYADYLGRLYRIIEGRCKQILGKNKDDNESVNAMLQEVKKNGGCEHQLFYALRALITLRNDSVIAHGFSSIDKNDIVKILKKEFNITNPEESIVTFHLKLEQFIINEDFGGNPFKTINNFLRKEIGNLSFIPYPIESEDENNS